MPEELHALAFDVLSKFQKNELGQLEALDQITRKLFQSTGQKQAALFIRLGNEVEILHFQTKSKPTSERIVLTNCPVAVKKAFRSSEVVKSSKPLSSSINNSKNQIIPLATDDHPFCLGLPFLDVVPAPLLDAMACIQSMHLEREHSSKKQEKLNARFERIQQIGRLGIWSWTKKGGTEWSREVYDIFELDPNQPPLTYKDQAKSYIHPDYKKKYLKAVEKSIREGTRFECEYLIILPGGRKKAIASQAIVMGEGDELAFEGVVQDVTHYHDIERSLASQIDTTTRILQNMLAGVIKVDKNGIITFANDSASHFLRESKSSLINRHFYSSRLASIDLEGEPIDIRDFPIETTLRTGQTVVNYIHGLIFPDGSKGWYSLNTSPLYNEAGDQIGAITNFYDITEEIDARKELENSQYRYRLIAENSKDLVALHHLDGSYYYISPNVRDVIGYAESELVKLKPQDLVFKEDLPLYYNSLERVNKGQNNTIRYRVKMKTGELKWYETHASRIEENGQPIFIQTTTRPIHEQKVAEDRLQQSERRFRQLVNEAPFAIEIYDREGTLQMANKHWEKMWSINKDELIGRYNTFDFDEHQDPIRLEKIMKPAFSGKRGQFKEWNYPSPDGTETLYFNINHFPIFDQEDNIEQVVFTYDQVTEEVRSRLQLEESEEKFRALTENLPGAIYLLEQTEKGWETVYINDEIKSITGHARHAFIRGEVRLSQLLHKDDLRPSLNAQKKALQQKTKFILEYRIQRKDGSWRWIKDIGTGLYDNHNKLKYIEGYVEDITERKSNYDQLQLSENRFRTLFEDSSQGIVIMSGDLTITDVNKKASQILGYSKREIRSMSMKDLCLPDCYKSTKVEAKEVLTEKRKGHHTEKVLITKRKNHIWVRFDLTSYSDPEQNQTRLVGIFSDITPEKEALLEIRSQEVRFKSIFNDSGHGVAILDGKTRAIEVNDKFRSLLGFTKKDLKAGIVLKQWMAPEDLKDTLAEMDQLLKQKKNVWQDEIRLRTAKNKNLWARLNLTSFQDPVSDQIRLVAVIEDITERKAAAEKLTISENFQHETVNAMPIALLVMSRDGTINMTNAVWQDSIVPIKLLGSGKPGTNFLNTLQKMPQGETILSGINDVLKGRLSLLEMEVSFGSDHEYWYSIRAKLLDPQFDSLVITLQDITVRRRIEQALEESLDKYRKIYNKTPIMMHSIDRDGNILSVSDFWLVRMGYQRHEVIGRQLTEFVTASSALDIKKNLRSFFRTGAMFNVSYQFVTKNDQVIDTLVSAIREGKGKVQRSLAVVTDITELRQAEKELQNSQKDLIEAQQLARIGNFDLNIETNEFSSSKTFDDLIELTDPADRSLSVLSKIVPEEEKKELEDIFQEAIKSNKNFEYTTRAYTLKSQKEIWIEGLGRIVKEGDRAVRVVGTIQDITKSKLSEIEIQKLSDRLSLATESAGIGVWELDPVSGEMLWQDTMYKLYQMKKPYPDDPWGVVVTKTHPDDQKRLKAMLASISQGEELIDADYRIETDLGERHLRSVTRQLKNQAGQIVQTVGVSFDITKDKELLENLEHSLREKDILIKEVHHRVKNNMQMVSSILALKSLDLTDEESKFVFDDCTNRIKSMAVVHDQLYRFYNVSEIDIGEYLQHLLRGLNVLLGGGNFDINVKTDDDTMDVDRALLCGLIISEIVGNAFKHGFKGKSEGQIDIKFNKKGEKRSISILNDGHPIPKDIFERQTNSLGMSLIKTFTRQLEGNIAIHPKENGFLLEF